MNNMEADVNRGTMVVVESLAIDFNLTNKVLVKVEVLVVFPVVHVTSLPF